MPRPLEHVLLRVAARRSPSTEPPGRGCEGLTDQRKALCQLTSVRASITETAKRRWRESGAPGPCWWECCTQLLGKQLSCSRNPNRAVTPRPAIPFCMYTRKIEKQGLKKGAPFTAAEGWEQPTCQRANKARSIPTVDYGSVSEGKVVPTPAAAWRNAENILSEISQPQKKKLHVIPLARAP